MGRRSGARVVAAAGDERPTVARRAALAPTLARQRDEDAHRAVVVHGIVARVLGDEANEIDRAAQMFK